MTKKDKLLKEALELPIQEKSDMIEQLIKSLDEPDPVIDELWKDEAEARIDAYEEGSLSSVSVREALFKLEK